MVEKNAATELADSMTEPMDFDRSNHTTIDNAFPNPLGELLSPDQGCPITEVSDNMKRFSKNFPCPICGGYPELPQGQKTRCHGFFSEDGEYAHCTREEHAGSIDQNSKSEGYPHRLKGECKCGKRHDCAGAGGFLEKIDDGWARLIPVPDDHPIPLFKHLSYGTPVTCWEYRGSNDRLLGYTVRFDTPEGGKAVLPFTLWVDPAGKLEWRWKGFPKPTPIYGQQELSKRPDAIVLVVEGEKARDAAEALLPEFVALTWLGGCARVKDADWTPLRGREVVFWPDADRDGKGLRAMEEAARRCLEVGVNSARIVPLPDALPDKWDLADDLPEGLTPKDLQKLIEKAPAWASHEQAKKTPDGVADEGSEGKRESQAALLVKLALNAGVRLFHSPQGQGFADIENNGHRETHSLNGKQFKEWLSHEYYRQHRRPPSAQALKDALDVLEGKAHFDGKEQEVFLRLGGREGEIYLDLGREGHEVVAIAPDGWRIESRSPVRFRRIKSLLPLPLPEHGGRLDEIVDILNINRSDWPLLAAWLISTFNPVGTYPLLILCGEQGTGKSTLARRLRGLIDPNVSVLRAEPKNQQDLMIAATNSYVLSFDNLSKIPDWLSDGLCRLSTGGGFATRALYSNDEEILLDAKRPVMLTGIDELASRGDLLDRAIIVNLPNITERNRRSEKEINARYDAMKGRILGALLDAVVMVLRRRPDVDLQERPRMADFAEWGTAAEPALGLEPGDFLRIYKGNRESQHDIILEGSPIGAAIKLLLQNNGGTWIGTATQFQHALNRHLDEYAKKIFPKTPQALSRDLRRIAPNLRGVGINVEFFRTKTDRNIKIQEMEITASPTSPTVPELEIPRFQAGDDQSVETIPHRHPEGAALHCKDSGDAEGAIGQQELFSSSPLESSSGLEGDDDDAGDEVPAIFPDADHLEEEERWKGEEVLL